jgi:hypothetical protein
MEKKTCSVCGVDKDLTKENYGWRKSRAEKGQNPWVVLHPKYPKWANNLKWVKVKAEAA